MRDKVCYYIKQLEKEGKTPVPISINVSRMHVYQEDFIDRIKKITSKYDINPKLIPLEITESAFTSEESSLYRKIKSLQDCGYRFSMDDFGSGYSSLGMLKDEHVDEVKIDKTFVDDIATDKGRILLKNVIQMIRALGIDMIAEGVETKEQAVNGLKEVQVVSEGKPVETKAFDNTPDPVSVQVKVIPEHDTWVNVIAKDGKDHYAVSNPVWVKVKK